MDSSQDRPDFQLTDADAARIARAVVAAMNDLPRCEAITRRGHRCSDSAIAGGRYCPTHERMFADGRLPEKTGPSPCKGSDGPET